MYFNQIFGKPRGIIILTAKGDMKAPCVCCLSYTDYGAGEPAALMRGPRRTEREQDGTVYSHMAVLEHEARSPLTQLATKSAMLVCC